MPKPVVIDLSHYQVIPESLDAAKAAGILGVIHKATEDLTYKDPKCAARFKLTRDAGLLWGIYHFLRPNHIKQQADWFLSQANLIDADTLLICDFEVPGIALEEVLEFLERVEEQAGQKPLLYSGNTLKELGGASEVSKLAEYRLWIAQYTNRAPSLPKGYDNWWLWQYSEHGKVPGLDGDIDVNAFKGSDRDLIQNWVIRTSSAVDGADSSVAEKADSANPAPNIDQPPINVQNIEKANVSSSVPVILPPDKTVEVKKESPTPWAKVIALFTAVSGLGINIGSLVQQRISELTQKQLSIALGGIALIAFGAWIYHKAAERAQKRTTQLVDKAADPASYTVELTK